jgi:hypothetical protein
MIELGGDRRQQLTAPRLEHPRRMVTVVQQQVRRVVQRRKRLPRGYGSPGVLGAVALSGCAEVRP